MTPSSPGPREHEFWDWFSKNEDRLFHFERDQERVFSELIAAMHKVHPDLTFEFGQVTDGRREFVISAGGHRTAFPAVESLYNLAPSLARWTFTKFRPRRPAMTLQIEDVRISPDDIEVSMTDEGERTGLTVFIRGFKKAKEEQYLCAAFVMLDHAIGEYDMETKVGSVDVKPIEEQSERARYTIQFLPIAFDDLTNS